MVRSASALLALTLLPSLAQAQQTPEKHRVVGGETLWSLAQQYYKDPYKWPRIYEANRSLVQDAHWIYPGEELVIPDVTATTQVVGQVTVTPAPAATAVAPAAPPAPASEPEHTIFYARAAGPSVELAASQEQSRVAVPRTISLAAPWLSPVLGAPERIGTIRAFSGAEDARTPRSTLLRFDNVELAFDGPVPARGADLLAFRVGRTIPGVGKVLIPTGVITVSDPVAGAATGLAVDVYDHMTVGDLLIPLPPFTLQPGVHPAPATTGADATIVGFANEHPLEELNDVAFLDQGADHGVHVGDEYVVMWADGDGTPPRPEGRLQVISVHPDHSSARIVWMRNAIFGTGVRVRVESKMP